ncbi:hypothetical protein XVE_4813 [Xanthomonas vesicatoria ATCC 35937]|uniref:Uncharacterized protein n=1 Tax=Xanthomonas vesicatoria ATCC 35937 TaxID=925775 RepID=F0BKJ8_9XANT|nr:hypothetical protein XVE_4813 [Xanthomonas vesicatoria ATCC 35937]
MSRPASEVLKDIQAFTPTDGLWRPLDTLLAELWAHGPLAREALPVLFGVFERFPTDDGAGVLWSIVHGVEDLPYDYENELAASNNRASSYMAEVMLARLTRS